MEKRCRICMGRQDMIPQWTSSRVAEGDSLPKTICSSCAYKKIYRIQDKEEPQQEKKKTQQANREVIDEDLQDEEEVNRDQNEVGEEELPPMDSLECQVKIEPIEQESFEEDYHISDQDESQVKNEALDDEMLEDEPPLMSNQLSRSTKMSPRPRSTIDLEGRRTKREHSYHCRICQGVHPLRKCKRFLRLGVEKRLRAVLTNRYCTNCLAHEHSEGTCRSSAGCKTCHQKHHTLLHMREPPVRNARSRPLSPLPRRTAASSRHSSASPRHSSASPRHSSASPRHSSPSPRHATASTPAPSLSTLLQRHSVNVLPTALVQVDTGLKTFDTAALIDPCTPVSCIDASLAAAFRLPVTCVGDERMCSATIRSRNNSDVRLEVVFQIKPNVRIRTPIRELSEGVRSHFRDIVLANNRFYLPAVISVILGTDVYSKIMQPGFLKVQNGLPVGQSTVFGWIVSGACHQP